MRHPVTPTPPHPALRPSSPCSPGAIGPCCELGRRAVGGPAGFTGPQSERRYLNHLRDATSVKIRCRRLGSFGAGPDPGLFEDACSTIEQLRSEGA